MCARVCVYVRVYESRLLRFSLVLQGIVRVRVRVRVRVFARVWEFVYLWVRACA